MVMGYSDYLALGGASVDNYFLAVAFFREYIQDLRKHLDGGSNRNSDHDNVAFFDAIPKGDNLVG